MKKTLLVIGAMSDIPGFDSLDCTVVYSEDSYDAAMEPEGAVDSILELRPDAVVYAGAKLENACVLAESLTIPLIIYTKIKDFSAARQALNSHVSAYVSQPEELRIQLSRILLSEGQHNAEVELLRRQVERSRFIMKDKLISDLLFGSRVSLLDTEQNLEFFNIEVDRFVLLAIEPDLLQSILPTLSQEDVNTIQFLVMDQLESLLEPQGLRAIFCVRMSTIYAILHCDEPEHEARLRMLRLAETLCNSMTDKHRFTVSVGISHVYENIRQLRRARKEGDHCLAARFHLGSNYVIHIDDINAGSLHTVDIDLNSFKDAVQSGRNVVRAAQALMDKLVRLGDEKQIKNLSAEAITAGIVSYCASFGSLKDLFDPPILDLSGIFSASTVENASSTVMHIAEVIQNTIDIKLSDNTGKIISQAKDFINKHYSLQISLGDVAENAHISQWYFSKLFRKETGTTFSDYLIQLRVRKARELLLANPFLKNYEVAESVGFSDSRYFSQVFKKVSGQPLSEFRRQLQCAQEISDLANALPANARVSTKKRESHPNFALPEESSCQDLDKGIEELLPVMEAVESGNSKGIGQIVEEALMNGSSPQQILNEGMVRAMDAIGQRYHRGEICVFEMVLAGRAMSAGIERLKPFIAQDSHVLTGKVVIGTVQGDMHDIGKSLVGMMLTGIGLEVIDLGVDVRPEEFVGAVALHRPRILCLSALLTTTMLHMRTVIEHIIHAQLRHQVKIMVGGLPITEEFALEIGADGYSPDASGAAKLAKRLIGLQ